MPVSRTALVLNTPSSLCTVANQGQDHLDRRPRTGFSKSRHPRQSNGAPSWLRPIARRKVQSTMIDRLELFTDDEIRASRSITLCTADCGWSQQVTGHWSADLRLPETITPRIVAAIELHEFDAAVERIRQLRADVTGDLEFEP